MLLLSNRRLLSVVFLLSSLHLAEAQTAVHSSPDKFLRAVNIPVGEKGYEGTKSLIEIRFDAKNEKESVSVNLGELMARERFLVVKDGKWGYIDRTGKVIWQPTN